jgi:uncharacterized protein (TIGR03435 family)
MKTVLLCTALVCLASAWEKPIAEKPALERVRFDSVSVTPDHSESRRLSFEVRYQPGPIRITMTNVTLHFALQRAYSMTEHQVFGPGWITSARYDITATLPPAAQMDQVWPALQALLDERFKLSLQHEDKLMRVYALTIARDGPKLQPARDRHAQANDPVSGERPKGAINLTNAPIKQFCEALSRRMDRLVVDETNISGSFDIVLDYAQSGDRSGVSIFGAIQRQLGLKLEPRNEMVDTLTVKTGQR